MAESVDQAWSTSPPASQIRVYQGFWTNWSHGPILGNTLTLSRGTGDILIAFTAMFVGFVGCRFWRIVCQVVYYLYSTAEPQGPVHHQRQVILRNASTPESALSYFLHMVYAWKKKKKSLLSLLPVILLAIGCFSLSTLAGIFSSYTSSSAGDEVLIDAANCGMLRRNGPDFWAGLAHLTPLIYNALDHALRCYSGNPSIGISCRTFIHDRTKTFIDEHASCPFDDRICRSNASNLILDSGYINSHSDLGVNSPTKYRVLSRERLHCAPLVTEGYSIDTLDGTYYNYGPTEMYGRSNYTYFARYPDAKLAQPNADYSVL
jgi:hypothetical protein